MCVPIKAVPKSSLGRHRDILLRFLLEVYSRATASSIASSKEIIFGSLSQGCECWSEFQVGTRWFIAST